MLIIACPDAHQTACAYRGIIGLRITCMPLMSRHSCSLPQVLTDPWTTGQNLSQVSTRGSWMTVPPYSGWVPQGTCLCALGATQCVTWFNVSCFCHLPSLNVAFYLHPLIADGDAGKPSKYSHK